MVYANCNFIIPSAKIQTAVPEYGPSVYVRVGLEGLARLGVGRAQSTQTHRMLLYLPVVYSDAHTHRFSQAYWLRRVNDDSSSCVDRERREVLAGSDVPAWLERARRRFAPGTV